MAESQNRYNLVGMGSIKDVDRDDIFSRSADGKTIVTKDGTKISDELIKQAKLEEKTKAAAVGAARESGVDLDDPQFVAKVDAIAEAAAIRVLNASKIDK